MSAFDQGYQAASKNDGDCPFYPGTRSESEWIDGFCKWLEEKKQS
ncbi:hypothetical protein [Pseudomonas sp. MWU12-2323]|nr:hypothetical protein [Pseudomonas sp. MWU12-2323]